MTDSEFNVHTEIENDGISRPFVSPAVIRRLPRYFRYLRELIRDGKMRISSSELSERMGEVARSYVDSRVGNAVMGTTVGDTLVRIRRGIGRLKNQKDLLAVPHGVTHHRRSEHDPSGLYRKSRKP